MADAISKAKREVSNLLDFSPSTGPQKKAGPDKVVSYGRRNGDLPASHLPREQRSRAVRGIIADRRGKRKPKSDRST